MISDSHYRNGKDITNPRDWYSLLSEKVRCKNGAIEYSHPDDNTFLPQLAKYLDLSYDVSKSPRAVDSACRRSSVSKSSSAYQHELHLRHHSTSLYDLSQTKDTTLTIIYDNDSSVLKPKPNRVTFLDVDAPEYNRSVSLPKLSLNKNRGVMPETSVIQNENLAHSHNEKLEEWFSQMPDETTAKAKRNLMEQNIQEIIKRKGTAAYNVPLPRVTKHVHGEFDIYPATYKELLSDTAAEDPILINRDNHRLQLKSLLKLNDGNLSIIDKLELQKREYIMVSPINREDVHISETYNIGDDHEEQLCESDYKSDLGFDPETCPLFIVSTKRAIPLDLGSSQSFKHGFIPQQRKLKRLKKSNCSRMKEKQLFFLSSETDKHNAHGTTVMSFDELQYHPLTRQPKHIVESVHKQERLLYSNMKHVPDELSRNQLTAGNLSGTANEEDCTNKKNIALLAKYKRLEVFGESNPESENPSNCCKVVERELKKVAPRLYSPVYKLDRRFRTKKFAYHSNLSSPDKCERINNVTPIRIENGVAIVGGSNRYM